MSLYRWAVYEVEFTEDDGRKVSKLCFVMFCPDDTLNKQENFIVACNKDQMKQKVSEVNYTFQINKWDDLEEAAFISKISK